MEIEKLIEQLKRHDGVWCSIPTGERLITKVTITLEQLQAENGRLRAELEKEEAARKKQADILCELRGQKYEQTAAINQLRAELEQVKRERDAAVEEIPKVCYYCKHRKGWKTCDKYNGNPEAETCESWKWRGWEAE